ncbi:hypothetical protein ACFL6S_04935 [Candidatus Poribacteria bacterium]
MLMLRKTWALTLVLFLIMLLSQPVFGEILFEDDFEADDIGDEPSLWNIVPGFTLQVVEDPENPDNKVLAETGEANGLGPPTPVGWEDQDFWTDYVWEFDWMWSADVYVGTAHRYQDAQHYYHSSRRLGGANFIIYNWDGNFTALQDRPWSSNAGVWYRMQSSDIGNEHTIKGKEIDDETPFDQLDPIVSVEDDTYAEGTIGLFGAEGVMYWDNIIVYEPGTDISGAVEPVGKLAVTWGKIKF